MDVKINNKEFNLNLEISVVVYPTAQFSEVVIDGVGGCEPSFFDEYGFRAYSRVHPEGKSIIAQTSPIRFVAIRYSYKVWVIVDLAEEKSYIFDREMIVVYGIFVTNWLPLKEVNTCLLKVLLQL